MPTFVIEVDGSDYEIEAPDEKAAVQGAMAAAKANPKKKTSAIGSGVMGAIDAASFGFSDEIGGGVGYLMGKGYESTRDSIRKDMEVSQRDNPMAYGVGQIGGGLATALVPGGALLRGVQGATKLGTAIGVGAAQGGLYGVGSGETAGERVSGGVKGAIVGGLVGGGTNKVGQAISGVRRTAIGAAPTEEGLIKSAAQKIENTKRTKIPAGEVQKVADKASKYLNDVDADASLQPRTAKAVGKLNKTLMQAYDAGEIDLGKLHNTRRKINKLLEKTKDPDDRKHLMGLKNAYDDVITKANPEYGEGIKLYERAMSSRRMMDMVMTAPDKTSGARMPLPMDQIKTKIQKIAEDPKALAKHSKDEQALIKKIAGGGRASDKYILGTLSKASSISGQMAGAIAGYSAGGGGVQGALAGQMVSGTIRKLNEAIKNKQRDQIVKLVKELQAIRRNAGVKPTAPSLAKPTTQIGLSGVPYLIDGGIVPEITVRPRPQ
jgi:hypothetical protein